jgi:hypothetical protein
MGWVFPESHTHVSKKLTPIEFLRVVIPEGTKLLNKGKVNNFNVNIPFEKEQKLSSKEAIEEIYNGSLKKNVMRNLGYKEPSMASYGCHLCKESYGHFSQLKGHVKDSHGEFISESSYKSMRIYSKEPSTPVTDIGDDFEKIASSKFDLFKSESIKRLSLMNCYDESYLSSQSFHLILEKLWEDLDHTIHWNDIIETLHKEITKSKILEDLGKLKIMLEQE